ncbi:hypothetical protein K4L44_14020 [Halosquirtibacter laminarini]|uniref:Uncharacterized protein n=1 Tax=Halosquirtibacter laminarini TaxID=3374600 RepID=A0AC61NMX6_9BACT|nr:hypothetical protein K4L44_14020 [Prolixibacteraceae bacterium]
MRRLFFVCVFSVCVLFGFLNVDAQRSNSGEEEPNIWCPNGCISKEKSQCYCYEWHAETEDYDWGGKGSKGTGTRSNGE